MTRRGQSPFDSTPRLASRLARGSFEPPSLTDIFGPTQAPISTPSQPSLAKETLLQARDLIIKASLETKDRDEQSRILDLLGVF